MGNLIRRIFDWCEDEAPIVCIIFKKLAYLYGDHAVNFIVQTSAAYNSDRRPSSRRPFSADDIEMRLVFSIVTWLHAVVYIVL